MRTSCIAQLLAITAVLSAPARPQGAQSLTYYGAGLFNGDTIGSSRPLMDAAAVLQARYGKLIAYEDPVWVWEGDEVLRDVGRDSGNSSMMAVVLTRRVFRLPAELTVARPPELTIGVLERVLAEYHRQNPGTRFRIVESKYGFHIVPETAHDASGRLVPARSVMDTIITVEEGTRTASDHFTAICQAISQVQGLRVLCTAIGVRENWYEKLFSAPGGTVMWGATAVTARDALADLLDRSATSFSWVLYCDRKTLPYGAPRCIMDLQPIYVARTDTNGNPALVRLQYDRRKQ